MVVDSYQPLQLSNEDGLALQFCSEELRGDFEIVMEAVSQHGQALEYAIEKLQSDRKIVMQAVSQDGCALQFASEDLKGDREVVMEAVSQDGWALEFATTELAGDYEIVMMAVSILDMESPPRCGSGPSCALEGPLKPSLPLPPHPLGSFCNALGGAAWAGVGEAVHGVVREGPASGTWGQTHILGMLD